MSARPPTAGPQCAIRAAVPADLPQLAPVWQEMMAAHSARHRSFAMVEDSLARWLEMAADLMARRDGFVLVAAAPPAPPLGFALGWLADNPPIYQRGQIGFVSELAVATEAQRRGVGGALLEACRRWFHGAGVEEFQLATAVWNEGAQALWRRRGGTPLLTRYRFDTGRPGEPA